MLVQLVPHLLDLYYNKRCFQLETVVIYITKLFFPSVVSVLIKNRQRIKETVLLTVRERSTEKINLKLFLFNKVL